MHLGTQCFFAPSLRETDCCARRYRSQSLRLLFLLSLAHVFFMVTLFGFFFPSLEQIFFMAILYVSAKLFVSLMFFSMMWLVCSDIMAP